MFVCLICVDSLALFLACFVPARLVLFVVGINSCVSFNVYQLKLDCGLLIVACCCAECVLFVTFLVYSSFIEQN